MMYRDLENNNWTVTEPAKLFLVAAVIGGT